MNKKLLATRCYCNSSKPFSDCCQPLLDRVKFAQSPEQLMRSRFSAFASNNKVYAFSTWHSSKRPVAAADDMNLGSNWVRLEILNSFEHQSDGTVEFIANYIEANCLCALHETSRFVKQSGQWYYLDGICEISKEKLTRNNPCPCLSGKKFKRCCGI